ncbi:transposase [Streptomyces formicae]|uniref:Transposase n=1 Tax=Streptomyces formicae TaxID=1616117 RepID=A0ABY3WJF2_9ACTN|nr:transposase [Streptomyces formicae]
MSDARWALIEPVFTAWGARRNGPGVAARAHDLREIVNSILYVNRTGIPVGVPAARSPALQDRLRLGPRTSRDPALQPRRKPGRH